MTVLTAEERVSHEAKEYWATLDLYNNSKMAFNKRSKSVRLKREKLNSEWQSRFSNHTQTPQKQVATPRLLKLDDTQTPQQKHDPETCKCVRCSIVYHETLIKSVSDMKTSICRKCANKMIACKCCSSSASSISFSEDSSSSSIANDKKEADNTTAKSDENIDVIPAKKANEFNQFEEKLFNIKNELVSFLDSKLSIENKWLSIKNELV